VSEDDRLLWRLEDGARAIECAMISCCAGAELQVRTIRVNANRARNVGLQPDVEIVLRELYPTKSDLYERARALEAEYRAGGAR
jgi:hypothetical protein